MASHRFHPDPGRARGEESEESYAARDGDATANVTTLAGWPWLLSASARCLCRTAAWPDADCTPRQPLDACIWSLATAFRSQSCGTYVAVAVALCGCVP